MNALAPGGLGRVHFQMVLGEHGSAIARGLLTDAASNDGLLEYSMVDLRREVGTFDEGGKSSR